MDSIQQTQNFPYKQYIDFISDENCANKGYLFCKRTFDVLFSSFILLLFLLPMGILAAVIYVASPGASPIFTQTRVGKGGKAFQLYKFRSMVPHAETMLDDLHVRNEMDGPVFKMKDDPRVTKIGRFLRRTGLDELPQFYNVLRGDMSIVGPRPPLPREVARYSNDQMRRLFVDCGLTCYWQVQPARNTLSFEEWVEMDMRYIRECSFLLDLKLILKTIGVMFAMQGR